MKSMLASYAKMMEDAVPGRAFRIELWDKTAIEVGSKPEFVLRFKSKNALARTIKDQFLGFGESYMAGEIEIDGDIQLLFRMGLTMGFGDHDLSLGEKLRFAVFSLMHRNTLSQSKKNISYHYDMGNDFYKLFLDKSMAYTCAYYHSGDQTLEEAQQNKYEHVCRKLRLQPGESLADLGCGWGGLLIYAAETYGISGVGVTLSKQQFEYANKKIAERGLSDRISVRYQDYRDLEGTFDKVCSIGMLEHVGKKFIPSLARKMKELLVPRGLGLLHFIGNDTPYPDDPWTAKYMFPGYHVPVLAHVISELAAVEQNILDVENIRMHYVYTLREWLKRTEANRKTIEGMYSEEFYRSWQIYLNVGIASFEFGGNRLFHILFANGLNNDLPLTREHLYCENMRLTDNRN